MQQAQIINRQLGQTEALYYLLDQLYCLNFVVFAQIDGELTAESLSVALAEVQAQHPLLRARIVIEQQRLNFRAVDAAKYPLQADWLPWRGWRTALENQLNQPFIDAAPLVRCFVFADKTVTTQRCVVALVFHHSIADGRSGTQLLIDLLRRAGGEHAPLDYRLAQPSAQALDAHSRQPLLKRGMHKARFWLDQGVKALKPVETVISRSASAEGERAIRVLPFTIKRRLATQLSKACRANDTTMHGALGAAQMLALLDENSSNSPSLALNSLADLRAVLDGGLTEHDLGLYIATLTTMHKPQLNDATFWVLASEIRTQLKTVLDSGSANFINELYRDNSILPPTRASARLLQGLVELGPAASMLTNIGRVAPLQLANGAAVSAVEFTVAPPPQCHFCITAASYEGVIYLNLLYDEAKYTAEQAKQLRDKLLAHLAKAANG